MSHLQSIIEKCHLANPKLLELSFGCEVKRKKDGEILKVVKWGSSLYNFISCLNSQYVDVSVREDDIEILGHPITLQDILLALKKDAPFGEAFIYGGKLCWHDEEFRTIEYDLTKSPYDQSEEVLEFISKNI